MASHPAGATAFIQEDFREPGKILADPALRATLDLDRPVAVARARQAGQQGGITYVPRSQAEVAAFFGGLDLVQPGVVPVQAWRPDAGGPVGPHGSGFWCAVGRKP